MLYNIIIWVEREDDNAIYNSGNILEFFFFLKIN